MAVLRHVEVTAGRSARLLQVGRAAPATRQRKPRPTPRADDTGEGADVPFERLALAQDAGAIHPDRHVERLRQAHLVLRIPAHRSRRQRPDRRTSSRATRAWWRPSRCRTSDELLLVTDKGQLIRTGVGEIRIAGRATQGVILINVGEDEHVVAAERLEALNGEAARRIANDGRGGIETRARGAPDSQTACARASGHPHPPAAAPSCRDFTGAPPLDGRGFAHEGDA